MSSIPADVQTLIDKARTMQVKAEECERAGGHDYRVWGLSALARPETAFPPFCVNIAEGNLFSSYHCPNCGNRVSADEGRAYMAKKRLNQTYFGNGDGTYSWLD